MRYQINKLTKGHSTKTERKFMELCKKHQVPFKYKARYEGYEIDFLIGRWAIEFNGHIQNVQKNIALLKAGYTVVNFSNNVISDLDQWLKNLKQYA